PADPADLVVRNERGVGPDPVFIEPPTDAARERHKVAEVHEHHRLAEGLPVDDQHFEGDQESGSDTKPERQAVIRRWRTRPEEQAAGLSPPIAYELDHQPRVGDEKSEAEHHQSTCDEVNATHARILRKVAKVVERLDGDRRSVPLVSPPNPLGRGDSRTLRPIWTWRASGRSRNGSALHISRWRQRARGRCSPRGAAYGWPGRRTPRRSRESS